MRKTEYGKWKKSLFTLMFGLCLVGTGETVMAAQTQRTQKAVIAKEAAEVPKEEKLPALWEWMLLYKGESKNIDIANVGGVSSVSFQSEDPSIVTVSKTGKIKAKSCGKTVINVELKRKKLDENGKVKRLIKSRVKIIVNVKISNLWKTTSYKEKMTKKSTNKKMPVFQYHKTLVKGKTSSVSLHGLEQDTKVSYKSTTPKVAKVDKNGKITAMKEGQTTIIISIVQKGCKYVYKEKIHVIAQKKKAEITTKQRNAYFSTSGFVGNSVAVGQRIYFNSKGNGFLGNPTMMVKECYSFYNDASTSTAYKVQYKGQPYRAKDAIALSKVKKVFINMGMNDLWKSPDLTYKDYVDYLKGIRKKNPNVIIFIESTTPVCNERQGGYLNNANVNRLNALMEKYCKSQKDMYYIDVSSALKGANGHLRSEYCSDGFVHITLKGYEVWTNVLCEYIDQLMLKEQEAKDAVATAKESRLASDYKTAKKKVAGLEKSTIKDNLQKQLQKSKSKIKK